MGSTVGLLVETVDVDDPNLLDLGRDQVLRGSHDVRVRHRLLPGHDAIEDGAVPGDLLVDHALEVDLEAGRHLREVEVHASEQRLHVRAGHECPEVAVHHPAHHVQTRVGAHQLAPPDVVQACLDDGSDRGQRVALGGHQACGGDAVDAGEHARPLELADVRRLAPTSGVEGGLIEDDGLR